MKKYSFTYKGHFVGTFSGDRLVVCIEKALGKLNCAPGKFDAAEFDAKRVCPSCGNHWRDEEASFGPSSKFCNSCCNRDAYEAGGGV